MLDSIHSPADMDHLIAERIAYAKSQEAENLTKDINHDVSANSQHKVNYVNQEPIDSVKGGKDTCLTQDLQEDDEVPNEFIEGEVDDYSTTLYSICT